MDRETRNRIQRATQAARELLEHEYAEQLEGVFDIRLDGTVAPEPGEHLDAAQRVLRRKLITAVEHQRTSGMSKADAVASYLREAAFTTLNRFVALKMLEARELVQQCISRGDQSAGFKEFAGLAPGLVQLSDHGYRVYIESLFDEIGREVRVLFDRRDPASLLWPRRQGLLDLLGILNASELGAVWAEDETIGWVYQYFNGEDERRQMRAESQAPRNSRELAVRNQFFTPRYVVQFLTDNTLGRIWYEMRQGDTRLRELDYLVCRPGEIFLADGQEPPAGAAADDEDLTQEGPFERPLHVPFRTKKDPRDVRVLDPACGSGHFLLYAFDLLLTIYEEGWADEALPISKVTGRTLREDYADLPALRAAVPGLILRHNIHGIDIDTRCAQIAALALWMRSQRAYKELGFARESRAAIQKTNIVVAEPMPSEGNLRREFIATLEPQLGHLVERVFDRMQLAGEAGSLLRIEDDISEAVRETYGEHGQLFRGSDEERWRQAEDEVLGALRTYAEQGANGRTFHKRLFVDDAARGLGFIDLCGQRYDAVLMNPPFGEAPPAVLALTDQHYQAGRNDIYAAFVLRACEFVNHTDGAVGAITSRAFVSGRDHRNYRRFLLDNHDFGLSIFLDLGSGVLDGALVETAAYVVSTIPPRMPAVLDLRDEPKPGSLKTRLHSTDGVSAIDKALFAALPECDFLYDLQEDSLNALANARTIEPTIGRVTFGLTTKDDPRFVRCRWEVPAETISPAGPWSAFAKGGEYSWFSGDTHLLVKQGPRGIEELAAFAQTRDGNIASTRRSSSYYYKPAVTFSRRSQKGFSARRLRPDACFSDKSAVIVPDQTPETWLPSLPVALASTEYLQLINSQSTFGSYEIGPVKRLPVPPSTVTEHADRWRKVYELVDEIDAHDETSQIFLGPPDFTWSAVDLMQQALEEVRVGLNASGLTLDERVADHQVAGARSREAELVGPQTWISYAIGLLFGRWSLAAVEAAPPTRIGPFDSAPRVPPAASGTDERPATDAPDITVDDAGHRADFAARTFALLSEALRCVNATLPQATWLDDEQHLRVYLASEFFEEHIKRYAKSRRKAPIYWQLATPSGRYSVWLYYHRLTRDTFYRVLNDYVMPKLTHEERKLANLTQDGGPNPSAGERKAIDGQEHFVSELRAFQEEITRVAPLWNPDLNDGVIINFAPLWRLVPQHRAWQKECKSTWDKLCKGDYDWAHLAMHLWPERVVPKCAEDRSLAIAHDLDDAFWHEDSDGKWQPRKVAQSDIDKLVKERTSAAVKDGLKSLLEAPAPATGRATKKKAPRAKGIRKKTASAGPKAATNGASSAAVDVELLNKVKDAIGSNGDGASKADVIDATGISASEWNKAIKALLADGSVAQTGERRGARYHLGGGDA